MARDHGRKNHENKPSGPSKGAEKGVLALGDDSREPLYIRTVSRHGYRFAFDAVREEPEDAAPAPPAAPPPPPPDPAPADAFERALAVLLAPTAGDAAEEGETVREAAESLHVMGTAEALRRLGRRPGHEAARALLRDARWDVPGAGPGGFRRGVGGNRLARHRVAGRANVRAVFRSGL